MDFMQVSDQGICRFVSRMKWSRTGSSKITKEPGSTFEKMASQKHDNLTKDTHQAAVKVFVHQRLKLFALSAGHCCDWQIVMQLCEMQR